MSKIDATVIKETKYIAVWVLILSILMQAVFLVLGEWDYTVILGNTLSGGGAVLNFFLMGLTVQNVLRKEESAAKTTMKASQMYRFLLLLVLVVIGLAAPCFHNWAVIPPVFFPRIAIAFRPLFDKKKP
jgi:hypothetical protein